MKILLLILLLPTIARAGGIRKFPYQQPVGPAVTESSQVPVCFSPDGKCNEKLVTFLAEAKNTIDVAIYDLNDPAIASQLVAKSKKVKVRVVCDAGESKGPHSSIRQLLDAGIPVRYGHQKGIMHDKFSIVDGQAVETGSFNYTTRAVKSNQENQLYLKDLGVVSLYTARFEIMWKSGKPVK